MKTADFLAEYASMGDDAHAMHVENEVQECRQKCYAAAKHAIKLHKLLQDCNDATNLDDWVLEKLEQASSFLQEIADHLEGDPDTGDEFILPDADFSKDFDHAFHGPLLDEAEYDYGNMSPAETYTDLGRRMLAVNKLYATTGDEQTKISARAALLRLSAQRERARKQMEANKVKNSARGMNQLAFQSMAGNPLPHKGVTESQDNGKIAEDASEGASCSGAVATVVAPLGKKRVRRVKADDRKFNNTFTPKNITMGKGVY